LSLQKANCVIIVDLLLAVPFAVPFEDPFDIVTLSINPLLSIVSVRLFVAVHPHEDEQGVQSVVLDSVRSQGKTFSKVEK
jgi:hypothetical protein